MIEIKLTRTQAHYLEFLIAEDVKNEPEYVNQSGAFKRFGRGNVERWVATGIIKRHIRPQSVEYNLNELRKAAANRQDYLITK
jgi:hypothetical protein